MFVRRPSPQLQRRPSIDGMQVPAKFLNEQHISHKEAQSKIDASVLTRRTGDRVAEQLQHNKASAAAQTSHKPIDIDLTLDDEKDDKGKDSKKRRFGFRKPSKKTVKRCIIALIILLLIGGGYFAYRILVASSHIFQGNVLTAFTSDKALKTDQYGRTNLLVFGTSESDPGHPGAHLTDSIMIVSIDQKAKTAFLASVPRDLWVKYDGACTFGYEGKVNTVYQCGLDGNGGNEQEAQKTVASKVGSVFGVDFQYTVHLNLAVLKEAVDALGGIDVTIESDDPRGILDRNFDWRCNYKCYLVKYPNGPAHLDGEHAMWLAQARNDAGGYGLSRSNFDREANQRKIVIGMKEKATSIGFLSNPVKVTNFIESLGNNVHTSIDAAEIKTFIKVAKEIDSKNINSISIIDQEPAILTTGAGPDGSSVVKSVDGLYTYTSIQAFMKKQLMGLGQIMAENAPVDVLNASGVTGLAATQAQKLEDGGLIVGNVANAPTQPGKYMLHDLSGGKKPATLKKLEQLLGVKAPTGTTLPAGITSTAPFVVIVGSGASGSGSSSQ